ncbi:hypothetical protein T492DRAFT_1143528 [Pavlovales sp. CCMP2436]|nr:hypothetical protein T492DRAFT_1143528 [Pavlovales sp. CCMP2436]
MSRSYAALFLPPSEALSLVAAAGYREGLGVSDEEAQRVATGAFDGLIRIWALRSSGAVVERKLARHNASVNSLGLSADYFRMVSVDGEGGGEEGLSVDYSRMVSADGEGAVHVWSAEGSETFPSGTFPTGLSD